jgi:NADH dehydrogenase/NADH:ubiquinone oxidoreductase subunit G
MHNTDFHDSQRLCSKFECSELLPGQTVARHEERTHGVVDSSSHAVLRDMSKCVLCSRCVRACSDVQGMDILGIVSRGSTSHVATFDELPLADTACISCGQCTAVCPVGALVEYPHMHDVQKLLQNKRDRIVVAHVAPAVRVAISEEFYMAPGTVSSGKIVTASKEVGFDYVFDTNFVADVTIVEEATEFVVD